MNFETLRTRLVLFGLSNDVDLSLGTLHLALGGLSLNKGGVDKAVDIFRVPSLRDILPEQWLAESKKAFSSDLALLSGSTNDCHLAQSNKAESHC
jgi:hypothetical protein